MNAAETLVFDGRNVDLKWFDAVEYPQNIAISQVVGFCVDRNNKIAIIKNKRGWGFPGGHPESGETPEETLRREIAEEAYITVENAKLLGYMEVNDPDNLSIEGKHYIQLRYLAKVDEILDFKKEFETSERAFVAAEELPQHIGWLTSPTGTAQFQALLNELASR